jgi:hypothetical protein
MNKKACSFILFSFLIAPLKTYAQGGDLLIQQYSKGPGLDENFSKWSLRIGPQVNRINTDLGTSSPTLTLGGGVELEYRLSKTVGLVIGAQYNPISYSYFEDDSAATDRLNYISYPLILRLQPTAKVSFGLGLVYQAYINGEKRLEKEDVQTLTEYENEVFRNTIGANAQIAHYLSKPFLVYINFRWVGRASPATQPQTNNTSGFQMGIIYRLWKSKLRF